MAHTSRWARSMARPLGTCVTVLMLLAGYAAAQDEEEEAPRVAGVEGTRPVAGPGADPPASDPSLAGLEDVEVLEETVVTAMREPVPELRVPRALNVVDAARIRERAFTAAVDALDDQIGVWVEKRTAHTSDLVIRGLSGGNLLALVDGNTLSTFWGEGGFAGDDMYGKINPDMLARIEVVRGPASVLYGSNALGGVVNFITKESPFDFQACGSRFGALSYVQVSSAPSGWRAHQEFFGATPRLRWIAGVTRMDYGTTRDGSGQDQDPTAARGWFGDTHLAWKMSEELTSELTIQYTHNDPVYRYYRPLEQNENERVAVAGWLRFDHLDRHVGFADEAILSVYYQDKQDERRYYNSGGDLLRWGLARWQTFQADLQLHKSLCNHDLIYGIELETTAGESPDDEQFTMHYPDGTRVKPAPDSTWSSLGFYVQDVWQVTPRLSLNASARVDGFRFDTDVDSAYQPAGGLDPSVDEFVDWQVALVGGLEASYAITSTTHLYGGWTRGFRQFAPRFGVSQHGYGIVVPNQFLDPVTADQFELGLRHRSRHANLDLTGYYTRFDNFQNIVPGTFQGSDWYDWNGDTVRDPNEDVYVTVGNGKAYVYGVELWGDVNLALLSPCLGEAWSVGAGFMWNYGQDETNDVPLRHTHPMRGLLKVRWEPPRIPPRPWVELVGEFVDRFDRIPPDRLANDVGYLEDPQDPSLGKRRPWGLPGYSVWSLHAGIVLKDGWELSLGVDNIFDRLYRSAHSRWDAPGRNFYATLTITL